MVIDYHVKLYQLHFINSCNSLLYIR